MKNPSASLIAAAVLSAPLFALGASSIPAQAPDVPGNAGGGPVDCKEVPTDRNCVSMNPKNDSNSPASRTNRDSARRPDSTNAGSSGSMGSRSEPASANETPGPSGRKNDRVQ